MEESGNGEKKERERKLEGPAPLLQIPGSAPGTGKGSLCSDVRKITVGPRVASGHSHEGIQCQVQKF